jgi:hypothetical protein
MRDDPYAKLSGLDQKLFAATSKTAKKGESATSRKRKKERPDVRSERQAPVGTKDSTSQRPAQRTTERPEVETKKSTSGGKNEGTFQRPAHQTRERLTRRPYDFYRDQVLWLNRTKVEIQERYDRRVTANAMVQLALDLLMADYKRRNERSKLVTKLVLNQRREERPTGRS